MMQVNKSSSGGYKMATAKPNQKIHVDKLQATLEKLEQLEEKQPEELTLRESIYFLRDKLRSALKKGYSYEDLSEILEQQGILVSAATLKQYLTEISKEASKGKRIVKSGETKRSSPKALQKKNVERASTSIVESKEKLELGSEENKLEENQERTIAEDTKSVQETDVNLLQESNQTTSEESLQDTKKPVRGKSKKLISSSKDLSSEFNQY